MRYELYEMCFPNGKRYFGITSKSCQERFIGHVQSALRNSKLPVHYAIRKHGAVNIRHYLIVVGNKEYIQELEIAIIAKYRTTDRRFGYNVHPGGNIGGTTPEMAAKISQSKLGQVPSEETKRKMSKTRFILNQDPAQRAKYGRKGHIAYNKGIPHTEERKEKIRQSMTGKKLGPASDERKNKISRANKGQVPWNKGIKTGEKRSPEHIAALRAGHKKYYDKLINTVK